MSFPQVEVAARPRIRGAARACLLSIPGVANARSVPACDTRKDTEVHARKEDRSIRMFKLSASWLFDDQVVRLDCGRSGRPWPRSLQFRYSLLCADGRGRIGNHGEHGRRVRL